MKTKQVKDMAKNLLSQGKTALKNASLDFHFALWLVCGAIVLAIVSWALPTIAHIPMTADMKGKVSEMYESYVGTRVTFALEDNVVKYTIPLDTFESLDTQPKVGDRIILKYEITSLRNIRMLKLVEDDGTEQLLYQEPNPALNRLYRNQWIAFGVYALFVAGCIVVYRLKKKRSEA